jgi:RimJ/RimL family protein N-acetyltransferase
MTSDHDLLLDTELETLWVRDAEGRLLHARVPNGRVAPYLVVGVSAIARIVATSIELPASLADELREMIAGAAATFPWRPSTARRFVETIAAATGSHLVTEDGPSYVIPAGLTAPSPAVMQTYDRDDAEALRARIPKEGPVEGHGPWAVALIDGNVASVCSTARDGPRGAEAGLYTYPAYRRKGFGAATTVTWASLIAEGGRTAFYTTSSENLSSQRVAQRLGLAAFAWWWRVEQRSES